MSNQEEKEKKPFYKKWWFWVIIVVIIIAIATSQGTNTNTSEQTSTKPESSTETDTAEDAKITLEEFNKIETGMTYKEVVDIIGGEGTVQSETSITGNDQYKTTLYSWEGKGSLGANANVTFQGGKVVSKAQFGLE